MTDIVERLRLLVPSDSSGAAFDAVNEIATLRAEVERLRAALEEIVKPGGADGFWECVEIARAALEEKQ